MIRSGAHHPAFNPPEFGNQITTVARHPVNNYLEKQPFALEEPERHMDRDIATPAEDRLQRRKRKLAELRATAEAGGYRARGFEEIAATVDHSNPEDPRVIAWMNDPDVGDERV